MTLLKILPKLILLFGEKDKYGTVGAIALDKFGNRQ